MRYRPRKEAAACVFLQPNPENLRIWLNFDLDHSQAWFIPEEVGMPDPTYITVNKANGHAHIGYLLEAPVSFGDSSRVAPIRWLADIEKGFTRRLKADFGYSGHTTRNPFHANHETDWQAKIPYRLDELDDSLDKKDKRLLKLDSRTTATGRNVTIFDALRQYAYRSVLRFKKAGKDQDAFRQQLMEVAHEINRQNYQSNGLAIAELAGIAKSVSEWTWAEFAFEKLSAIQSSRGKRAWSKKHGTITALKPWLAQGISRATYYRRNPSLP